MGQNSTAGVVAGGVGAPFQVDLQWVPTRILSLRLSFCDIYIYMYI